MRTRFSPDSARTKNPNAEMAVTQKTNRAAFDIFIFVFVPIRVSIRDFSTEAQPTLCSSAQVECCAEASDQGKQNEGLLAGRKVTELLPSGLPAVFLSSLQVKGAAKANQMAGPDLFPPRKTPTADQIEAQQPGLRREFGRREFPF
jgi:hypothetical protein